MCLITCGRSFRTRSALRTVVAFLLWSTALSAPWSAQALELPLGLAAGSGEAKISRDGKQWATLTASSNPIFDRTMLRTGNGVASAMLKDGAQLEIQPQSVIRISGSRNAPVVTIAVGRVFFRLSASSQMVFVTPSIRYLGATSSLTKSPAAIKVVAVDANFFDRLGEIVVNQRGGSRIELRQGEILARAASDSGLHIVKVGESVYFPQIGVADPDFRAMLAQALPGDFSGAAGGAGGGAGTGSAGFGGLGGLGSVAAGGGLAGGIGGAVSGATGGGPGSPFTP